MMKKKQYSWPLLMALLCSFSAIEAPIIYLNDLFESNYALSSNLLVSFSLLALSWMMWRNILSTESKRKQTRTLFWPVLFTFSAIPFALVGPKVLIMLKLLRLSGLVIAHHDLQASHEISRPKKIFIFIIAALTGVHLVATTWMMIEPNQTLSAEAAYIKALYWSVTTLTTTGYGDITPTSDLGRLFTIFVMLSGFSAFGILVGNVSNLIMAKNRHQEANHEKLEDLATFMQYYQVPRSLRSEVFGYHSHRMQKRLSENDSKIISDLPHGLQNELQIYVKMKLIDGLPIFHGLGQPCLKLVAQHLEPMSYSANSSIIKRGDQGDEMFIIDQGEVEVSNSDGLTVAVIKHGQCVGEMALLTQTLRTADVKAKSYCDVYRLKKTDFDLISTQYPELEENFRRIMVRRSQDRKAA
jgi:voltage-gated potassium channel